MRKCKEGNPKYQALLYEQYSNYLMGVCMRYTRNEEDAKDLLQDVFVKIFTNIDSCKEDGNMAGWIHAIAVNTAINAYHKKKRKGNTVDMEDVEEMVADIHIQQNDFLSEKILMKFVNELPDGYRTVFNLFEIDGYSHREVSEMMGSSYSTVRSQLFKAKRSLQKKIEAFLGKELKDKGIKSKETTQEPTSE